MFFTIQSQTQSSRDSQITLNQQAEFHILSYLLIGAKKWATTMEGASATLVTLAEIPSVGGQAQVLGQVFISKVVCSHMIIQSSINDCERLKVQSSATKGKGERVDRPISDDAIAAMSRAAVIC